MKYLKKIITISEYNIFKDSEDYITPNVSLIDDQDLVIYNKIAEAKIEE